jgi:hypothetical protein
MDIAKVPIQKWYADADLGAIKVRFIESESVVKSGHAALPTMR